MTYAFKLSQRLARFRAVSIGAAVVLTISCADNLNQPTADPAATGSQPVVISPDSTTVGVDGTVQFAAATDSSGVGTPSFRQSRGRGHSKTVVSLTVSPPATTMGVGGKVDYTATAQLSDGSTMRPALQWTATGGTVDSTGVYTAGKVAGTYHVVAATSGGVADTAAVTVTDIAPVLARIALTPAVDTVPAGGSQQFAVAGQAADGTNVPVTPVYAATGGTISSSGLYSAGQTAGSFRVIARDSASGKADTSAVTIAPQSATLRAVLLTPSNVSLNVGAGQQFTATGEMSDGSTTSSIAVTWTASGGAISPGGLYAAGQTAGSYRVIASAGGKADTAAVAIAAPPSPTGGCTGVTVSPGTSLQGMVTANPAGTTFCLQAGTWLNQSVIPKDGDRFIGAPNRASVMDGRGAVAFAFDLMASTPYPNNGTIQGLKITGYNPPYQSGAIRGGDSPTQGGSGWLVRDNEISENATGGLRLGPRMRAIGNYIHHNHAIGIVGTGRGITVDSNEIAFNNYLKQYDWGGEAGGTKFASTDSIVVRGNYSHDNWGPGLWTDINNRYTLYEGNRVEDNAGPGIYHEISYDAVIRNNVIKRNGFDFAGWIWGGGIQISTSQNVLIENNTLEDNKTGISVVAQVRGYDWVTRNITVRNNTVTQRSGVPAGAAADIPTDRPTYYAGIKFTGNQYFTRSGNQNSFEWADGGGRSWSQWKGYGLDTNGSLTIIP